MTIHPDRDDESLRTTVAILKAQQEATLDGILVVDTAGKILSYNRRFIEIWGVPEAVAAGATDAELLSYAERSVLDWGAFIEVVRYLYSHPEEVRSGDPVPLKDGRLLSRASVPVKAADGAVMGRAWYFRDITDARKAERLQAALFRIAQLSRSSSDLRSFYGAVHTLVGELMEAGNFFIAEYDDKRDILTFPYFVDQFDPPPEGKPPGHGLTAFILRTGRPLLARSDDLKRLYDAGEVEPLGTPPVVWLGVPLKSGERTWGVLAVQTYDPQTLLTERNKELLVFVSQHVASAIEQKRHEDALRDSERRYRQMFENNRAVQLLVDPESGSIVDGNMAACEFYGYTADELRSLHVWDINVLGAERVREEMAAAAAQKRNYSVFRHKRASGEIRDVEVHSGPIEVGSRTLLYSIVHDITERKSAENALQQSEEKYRAIFDYAPVGIYQSTRSGQFITANLTMARMLGYESVAELQAVDMERDVYFHPAERLKLMRFYESIGDSRDHEVLWKKKDGTPIWVQLNAHAVTANGRTLYFEGFVTDITERKQAEETLLQQSTAISASTDGIGILNETLQFTYVNEALAKLYGYPKSQSMIGQPLQQLYDDVQNERLATSIVPAVRNRGFWRGEATGKRRDGFSFPQEISITTIEGGGMVCVVRDITERTYAEEQIKHLAYHDALTGLPNRLLFKDRLTVAVSHAQRDRGWLAVLFLDLDRFKVINDSLGHNIGDQLLQAVAARIHSCVRESDTVARLGGDEFTLLLPALARSEDAALVAQKILEAIRYPFHIEGREFFITTSVGISIYPEDGNDAVTLIKNADTAMYQAKEQGRDNYQLFNAYVNARALQRIALEHGLRRALVNHELVLHYQPILDLRTDRITGMEALLRWAHPEMGLISPGVFIPIAEAIGAMVPIGYWAMKAACAQARAWHDNGHKNLSLSVNLSVTQLQQHDLAYRVKELLDQTGLPPRLLEIEITESGAMQNPDASIRTLYDLKKLGVRISLDDFGTGHSSLSYLKRFPIDTLKIDQSFVRDITSDPDTAAIVTAIIAMAHSLRLKVVAEGVEFSEQAAFLRKHSCDQMQGYLIRPPLPAAEFLELLSEGIRDQGSGIGVARPT